MLQPHLNIQDYIRQRRVRTRRGFAEYFRRTHHATWHDKFMKYIQDAGVFCRRVQDLYSLFACITRRQSGDLSFTQPPRMVVFGPPNMTQSATWRSTLRDGPLPSPAIALSQSLPTPSVLSAPPNGHDHYTISNMIRADGGPSSYDSNQHTKATSNEQGSVPQSSI